MRKQAKELAIGTAIAAGIGYVAGILTAPKSGKETRKDIERVAVMTKREAERKLKALHSELAEVMDNAKKKLRTAKSGAKDELSDILLKAQVAKEKAREMLSALHEGDAEDEDLKKAIADVNQAIDHLKKYLAKDA